MFITRNRFICNDISNINSPLERGCLKLKKESLYDDKKQLEVDSYLFFCPSENAIKFARELISNNVSLKETTSKDAIELYKNYLKLKIIQLGESPCLYEESIEGIVPVFRSIYESTIKPTVEGLIDNYVDTLNLLNSTKKRRKKGIVNLTLGY